MDTEIKLPDGEFQDENADRFQKFGAGISNTFSHAAMLQNWFMWDIKSNYDNDYRDNFLTRATIQNGLGGSSIMLMTNSSNEDLVLLDEFTSCAGAEAGELSPYYVRRANYFAAQLWRVISDNHLEYLKTVTSMASLNNNVAPTTFIDVTEQKLYLIYTNVTENSLKFALDYGNLNLDYGGAGYEIIFDTDEFEGLILDADQLYSTGGKGEIRKINNAYDDCEDAIWEEGIFEIDGLNAISPLVSCPSVITGAISNVVCVSVPGVSMGYLVIPFHAEPLRLGNLSKKFAVYPNPASTHFIVQQKDYSMQELGSIKIKIYTLYGSLIREMDSIIGQSINISDLPTGVYTVLIGSDKSHPQSEILIKMK